MVAGHQECVKCGAELSRIHAVACSRAGALIDHLGRGIPVGRRLGPTVIDWVINALAKEMKPDQADLIVEAIDKIERECRGRERSATGFWS